MTATETLFTQQMRDKGFHTVDDVFQACWDIIPIPPNTKEEQVRMRKGEYVIDRMKINGMGFKKRRRWFLTQHEFVTLIADLLGDVVHPLTAEDVMERYNINYGQFFYRLQLLLEENPNFGKKAGRYWRFNEEQAEKIGLFDSGHTRAVHYNPEITEYIEPEDLMDTWKKAGIPQRDREIMKAVIIDGHTQEETGEMFDITRQGVSYIIKKSSKKIESYQTIERWKKAGIKPERIEILTQFILKKKDSASVCKKFNITPDELKQITKTAQNKMAA